MMVLKRKSIVILTLVLLIVAAGYISTKYGRTLKVDNSDQEKQTESIIDTDTKDTSTQAASGYFVDVKLGRDNQRTADKQTVKDMIDNKNTTAESRKKAENELMNLVKYSEKEMIMEAVIKSKGFDDALVLMSDSSVNVTVRSKELKSDQVSQIKNIVCRESGLPATKVTIQCKE